MRRFPGAVLKAALVAAVALAGCGGGGGSSSSSGGTGTDTTRDTNAITGKVVSTKTGNPGVANVVVTLGQSGTQTASATTKSDGTFSIPIPTGQTLSQFVLAMYPTASGKFSIDLSGSGSAYSNDYELTYTPAAGTTDSYAPTAITVPVVQLTQSPDLGTITVYYYDSTDTSAGPPPPPADTSGGSGGTGGSGGGSGGSGGDSGGVPPPPSF